MAAAIAVACALLSTHPVSAADRERMVADISVNTIRKGEVFTYATPNGDFLVAKKDLVRVGLPNVTGQTQLINGEEYVSLRSATGIKFKFNDRTAELLIEAAADLLPKQVIDFESRGRKKSINPSNTNQKSGFINYGVSVSQDNSGAPLALQMSMEIGASVNGAQMVSGYTYSDSNGRSKGVRLMTAVTIDRPDKLERVVMGDFFSESRSLSSSFNMGGISYSKLFRMNPNEGRSPTANFNASVTSPSEVEVYLDGVRIRSEKVAPGSFDLRNIDYYGGSRDIEIVIRDRFGREERLNYQHYFTSSLLTAGFHEWSYNLGAPRRNYGIESNRYGRPLVSLLHRYGYNDWLTFGGYLNAGMGMGYNVGGEITAGLGKFGVISGNLGTTEDSQGNKGHGRSLEYTYERRQFSARAFGRSFSDQYSDVGSVNLTPTLPATTPGKVISQWGVGSGYGNAELGSFSFNYSQTNRQFSSTPREVATLGYSRSLGGGVTLFSTFSDVKDTPAFSGREVYVGLSWALGKGVNMSAYHQERIGAGALDSAQIVKNTPSGEGLGYRITVEQEAPGPGGFGGGQSILPSVQYNGPVGVYTLDSRYRNTNSVGKQRSDTASLAGSVVYAGGEWGFSRPVNDAFAIVKVPDLPDVRVFANSEEIGKTDKNGLIIIPRLGSYVETQISVSDRDVPMSYSMPEVVKYVTPAFRSGLMLAFDIKSIKAVGGSLFWVDESGKEVPAEAIEARLRHASTGERVVFGTARGGEFFVENLKPGRYLGEMGQGKRICKFVLEVQDKESMMMEAGKILCK